MMGTAREIRLWKKNVEDSIDKADLDTVVNAELKCIVVNKVEGSQFSLRGRGSQMGNYNYSTD